MCHIYYRDKDIIFVENYNGRIENIIIFAPRVTVDEMVAAAELYGTLLVVCDDPKACFEEVLGGMRRIEAAGGVVTNDEGELLMIKRYGAWDLPKGKIEHGEERADCAVREVEEECGIDGLMREELRGVTHHIYRFQGEWAVKPTYWYNMRYPGEKKRLVPQAEEGIEMVEWVPRDEVWKRLEGSYAAIRGILSSFRLF